MLPGESERCNWDENQCHPNKVGRNLVAPRDHSESSSDPTVLSTHHDHRPHPMQSRTTLKRRSSRTQQRHLENLPTSLQTFANNERSFHSSLMQQRQRGRVRPRSLPRADPESCKTTVSRYHRLPIPRASGALYVGPAFNSIPES